MRAALLLDAEFQDAEAIYPLYRLQEAGFKVDVLGRERGPVKGKWGYSLDVTKTVGRAKASDYALVVVPGGNAPDKMRTFPAFARFVASAAKADVCIAAICHGPSLLVDADVLKGRRVTSYVAIRRDLENAGASWSDEEVVIDGGLITSRKPDDLPAFMAAALDQAIVNGVVKVSA